MSSSQQSGPIGQSEALLEPTKQPSGPQQDVTATLDLYGHRRPALEPVLEAFRELLCARERLTRSTTGAMTEEETLLPGPDPQRQGAGAAMLPGSDLSWAAPWLLAALRELLPAMHGFEPLREEAEAIAAKLADDVPEAVLLADLTLLAESLLAGDPEPVARQAAAWNLRPQVLGFVLQQGLAVVLGALVARMRETGGGPAWREGNCPVCGSVPALSFLAKPQEEVSEFLQGGGGQKYLHCSLCGHDWRFPRGVCPSCRFDGRGALQYLADEDQPGERIDFCSECNVYLPSIDLREFERSPDLNVAPLGLLHLDLLAAQRNLKPLAAGYWSVGDE